MLVSFRPFSIRSARGFGCFVGVRSSCFRCCFRFKRVFCGFFRLLSFALIKCTDFKFSCVLGHNKKAFSFFAVRPAVRPSGRGYGGYKMKSTTPLILPYPPMNKKNYTLIVKKWDLRKGVVAMWIFLYAICVWACE